METNPNISQHETETTSQYLARLRSSGYLFHGSSNKGIAVLEPRYTEDKSSQENTDTAVFATSNLSLATIFGLYGGHKGWATRENGQEIIAKIPLKDKELIENTTGTIYILSPDSFTHSEGEQYKSHQAVTPIRTVEVKLQDYFDLGGKITWF